MRRRIPPVSLVLVVVLLACGALVFRHGREQREPVRHADSWRLEFGALARLRSARAYRVLENARLVRDEVSLDAEEGTLLRFETNGADPPGERITDAEGGSGPAATPVLELPYVLEGKADVTLEEEARIGAWILSPLTRSRLTLTRRRVEIVFGSLRAGGRLFGPEDVFDPRQPPPEREPAAPPPEEGLAPEKGGGETLLLARVLDARTLAPVPEARCRVVFSESEDGYPPLSDPRAVREVSPDTDGGVRLEPFRPWDPRVRVLMEVEAPGYLPLAALLTAPPDARGRRRPPVLYLRRGLTRTIRLSTSGGRPLAGAAVLVEDLDAPPFFTAAGLEPEEIVRRDRLAVRYTGPDGTLQISRAAHRLVLLHPEFYFWDETLVAGGGGGVLLLEPPGDSVLELQALSTEPRRYAIETADRTVLASSLIEIESAGRAPVRLYTDGEGGFLYGPRPLLGEEFGSAFRRVQEAVVRSLDPLLYRREARALFPLPEGRIVLPGLRGGILRLRMTVRERNGEVHPLAPASVKIDRDLTLVRLEGNIAEFAGALPPPGSFVRVSPRDCLPEKVQVPAYLPPPAAVETTRIECRRGESVTVRFLGAGRAVLEHATLYVTDAEAPWIRHAYRLGGDGSARVGGLAAGRAYDLAVDGPWVDPVRYRAVITEEAIRDGIDFPLGSPDVVRVAWCGRLEGILPERAHDWRVIERLHPEGGSPAILAVYPLAPDGVISGARVLPRPERFELLVLGPGFRRARAVRGRIGSGFTFDFGLLPIEERHRALLRFLARGAGPVAAPAEFELDAEAPGAEELVLHAARGPFLLLDNLLPGRYRLRWRSPAGGEHLHAFEVPQTPGRLDEDAVREAEVFEEVLVEITSEDGSVPEDLLLDVVSGSGGGGAAVPPDGKGPAGASGANAFESRRGRPREFGSRRRACGILADLEAELSRYVPPQARAARVRLPRDAEVEVRIRAEGFLPVVMRRPAGAELPPRVVLRRGVAADIAVLGPEGARYEGPLEVEWRSAAGGEPRAGGEAAGASAAENRMEAGGRARGTSVELGERTTVFARAGAIQGLKLASGRVRLELAAEGGAARVRFEAWIPERGRVRLGPVRLEERRSIEGSVLLPDGSPAPHALVALVDPASVLSFPQRGLELREAEIAARTDASGRFRIENPPTDPERPLALLARLEGYSDAVESPLDLSLSERILVLKPQAGLLLDVGHADPVLSRRYAFRLFWRGDGAGDRSPGENPERDLGLLDETAPGGELYLNVTPGTYRVTWEPQGGRPPGFVLPSRSAEVRPGAIAALRFRIADPPLPGRARFNGSELRSGWVLLTPDPSDPSALRPARVEEGRFLAPVPVRARRILASFLPDRDPPATPRFEFGEALPLPVGEPGTLLRSGELVIDYRAHDLRIEVPPSLLEDAAPVFVEFPHYEWDRDRFHRRVKRELLEAPVFTLEHLQPGKLTVRIAGRGGLRSVHYIELDGDRTIRLRR